MTDMPIAPTIKADPLARYGLVDGAARGGGIPVPLTAERMRIVIRGGLALVSREQTFRNRENSTIEATITFPVPIHATLHRLTAKIGERTLAAAALPRSNARDTYEKAVDDGRTAVLHEELIRGVHLLSIAHIPSGAEVAVTHSWISALSPRGPGKALLRIPVTLGDVYGDSPFSDADDVVVSRSVVHEAEIEVDSGAAVASIAGSSLADGRTTVRLDAPIDLEVAGMTNALAHGVSADGRSVLVSVVPDAGGDANIDAAILVDRSGSMGDAVSWNESRASAGGLSKHAAVAAGLADAGRELGRKDRTELWQFDSTFERLSDSEMPLIEAVGRLGEPRGGTEIGAALSAVAAASPAADIILITDGLSHALNVQALVNSGRRFTVVLVGENSLEANVGRLAALTGGQIVLATGAADAAAAVRIAIASVRRPKPPFQIETWPLDRAAVHAGGAIVEASWGRGGAPAVEPEFGAAVGALAAAIAIPFLREDQAVKVATDHGIVCHLTSLVLVDEAGAVQEGLPAQRKVPLMAARSGVDSDFGVVFGECASIDSYQEARVPRRRARGARGAGQVYPPSLSEAAKRIDWSANPEALRRGDLTGLPPEVAELVLAASEVPEVLSLATPHGNAVAVVIALIAESMGGSDRAAARLARAVLMGLNRDAIAKVMAVLGL